MSLFIYMHKNPKTNEFLAVDTYMYTLAPCWQWIVRLCSLSPSNQLAQSLPSPTQSEPKSHWYPPIWIHIHTAYLSLVNDPTLPLLVLAALPLFCLYDDFVALLPPCSDCIALRLYTASSLVKLFSLTFNVLSEALNSCTCLYMYEKIRKASHCSCNENYWSNKKREILGSLW